MIITLDEAKEYMNIDLSNTDYDSILTNFIKAAGNEINIICNQEIEAVNSTIVISGNGKDTYQFSKFPVNAVNSLKYRNDLLQEFASITPVDSSKYSLIKDSNLYILYYEDGFKSGRYNYEIQYNNGYTEIPDEIKQVAKEMVSIAYKNSPYKDNSLGLQVQTVNIRAFVQTNQFKNMFKEWQNRLKKYRRITI